MPNFTVVKEDSEEDEWGSAADGPFDYVHLRFVFLCFQDPMRVLRKAFEHLRPGGWVEYQDPSARLHCVDGSIAGTALERYWELVLEGGRAAGRDFLVAEKYKAMLEEAGFVDIVEERVPMPSESAPNLPLRSLSLAPPSTHPTCTDARAGTHR